MIADHRSPHVNRGTRLISIRLVLALLLLTLSSLVGCGSTARIQESDLSITPTEPLTSFSKTSQGSIQRLNLAPDRLADPESLVAGGDVAGLSAVERSLLVSEAWYLRGQNDVEVPIAISLDRFLRAAHFAYDGIFAGGSCEDGQEALCRELYAAYNRAAREVARLTMNGNQLPEPSAEAYALDREGEHNPLELSEWEISLEERPLMDGTLGASGSACQAVGEVRDTSARLCAAVAFIVTFDSRADDGPSRAHVAAYNTSHRHTLVLHNREIKLPSDHHAAWAQLLASTSVETLSLSCLADIDSALPTVLLLPHDRGESSEWPLIAADLSSDSRLGEHYNFCSVAVSPLTQPNLVRDALSSSLSTLALTPPPKMMLVLIAQGSENDTIVRDLKRALKEGASNSGPQFVVAGSLTLQHHAPQPPSDVVAALSAPTQLSKGGRSAVSDSKRLLSKLVDDEDGALGGVTRSSVMKQPGSTLSPVM